LCFRKTWLLFPPEDLNRLHPTRVPYEESSVYSSINFSSQSCLQAYLQGKMRLQCIYINLLARRLNFFLTELKNCSPLKVTLEPGDCLYVPPEWWHFVQSEDDFTISINTWIELVN